MQSFLLIQNKHITDSHPQLRLIEYVFEKIDVIVTFDDARSFTIDQNVLDITYGQKCGITRTEVSQLLRRAWLQNQTFAVVHEDFIKGLYSHSNKDFVNALDIIISVGDTGYHTLRKNPHGNFGKIGPIDRATAIEILRSAWNESYTPTPQVIDGGEEAGDIAFFEKLTGTFNL